VGLLPHTGSRDVVRTHMRNLRAKIRHTTAGREIVRTLPRRGYRLVVEPGAFLDFVVGPSYALI